MLISLKQLRKASQALKDGHLDVRLDKTSDDELGDVTEAFNEMAAALTDKTFELQKKDIYIGAMLDPLWVVDEANVITDINPAFTRLFGHSREDVIGASVYDFFDQKNAEIMRKQLNEKREKGISSIYEICIFSKDGSQIPVLISGAPIYSGERITGKIGILKDFREQSELRNELQQSKDYLEKIMDSIQDELLVIDRDYKVVKANKTALSKAKMPVEGEFCHIISHKSHNPCWTEGFDCPVQVVFNTGRSYSTVHRHMHSSGEIRHLEIMASPVRDSSGNIVSVIELMRDVTERIESEKILHRKNLELMTLNSIAGLLSRSLRPDEIFSGVLDKLLSMMKMDGGAIFFLDEEKRDLVCQCHRGISDEYIKIIGRVRLGEDIPGKVAVTGEVMTSADVSRDQRVEKSPIRHSGIRGYCCVPIRGKERILGVFSLFTLRTRIFSDEEEKILNAIGEMTGIAFENIGLYMKMRQMYEDQRRRREEEHAQLLSLSTKLGSSIELKEVMAYILDQIRNIFRADFVWMLVNDREGNLLLKSATSSVVRQGEVVYQAGISSIEGYSIEKQAPTVIENMLSENKFFISTELAGLAYHTALAVPMHIGKKPIGAFTLYTVSPRVYGEEEVYFLEIIANILAVALERSDIYNRSIVEKGLSETILQSVTDSIISVDNAGRIISFNRAFEGIIGMPLSDVVGHPVCDILRYSEENGEFNRMLCECVEKALAGTGASNESFLVTSYGSRIPVLINSDPVLDTGGAVMGAVNLLRDIRKEKEIDIMKTELIRSVSHEFRTPLSAIVGMTEMILEEDLDDRSRQKYLQVILSEGIRLSSMVNDLLNIAKIESGKESLTIKSIDMDDLSKKMIDSFSDLVEQKKACIEFDSGDAGEIIADEEKIRQVLFNLIDNALTFSDEGCKIKVVLKKERGENQIIVSDTGWGIPEEDIPHLSERFYRGKHGEKVKGTGLGLSLCSDVVKMHGGKIEFRSRLGEGTVIIISLPDRRKSEQDSRS